MKTIFNYFLRGLLFVFPVGITLYIIISAAIWSNETFNNLLFEWLNLDIPGLGIITVFLCVSFLGYIFSKAFTRPIVQYFDRLFRKVPLVKILYTSLKELTEAFVGDKKRFNKPVQVKINESGALRFGFLTKTDLNNLKLKDMVAVYCPHSYNFSGNLYMVPADAVTPLNVNSTDLMRYIVSGGVTQLRPQKHFDSKRVTEE